MTHFSYDYIRRMYGVDPQIGERVQHTITLKYGFIRKSRSPEHYVHVEFDGARRALPCHPTELNYNPQDQGR